MIIMGCLANFTRQLFIYRLVYMKKDNFELFKYAYKNVIANWSNFSFHLDRDDRFLKIYPLNTEQDAIEFDIENK